MADTATLIRDHAAPATRPSWREMLKEVGPELEAEGRACDRENRFASANLDRLQTAGFFALGVPKPLGGGGAGPDELGAMLRAVARFDGSTALALSMHTHLVAAAEWRRVHANAPTEALLSSVAEGKRLVSSGGSDWLPGSGRAEPVDGGYRIFARKVFSSGSPAGDVLMTTAVLEDGDQGPTVLHFGLPMNGPEVSIRETWDALGMRGTASHEIDIAGAFVPEAAIVVRRPAGKWHMSYHLVAMIALPLIYSVYAGVADAMRDDAVAMAKRKAADAGLIVQVGELETTHLSMDLAHRRMMRLSVDETPSPNTTAEALALRTLLARAALDVGSRAMDLAGGAGFFRAAGLEQRFRDLQGSRYHPLPAFAQASLSGRLALGLGIDG